MSQIRGEGGGRKRRAGLKTRTYKGERECGATETLRGSLRDSGETGQA